MRFGRTAPLALWLAACAAPAGAADDRSPAQAISASAFPGTIELSVDATDLEHHVLRVHERVPVAVAGRLRLSMPQWIPGHHSPTGRASAWAGLQVTQAGQALAWRRDPLDMYTFEVDVPAGTSTLDIDFQSLSPVVKDTGRVVMTPVMLNLQWNDALVYPSAYADTRISVRPSVRLPDGWPYATSLEAEGERSGRVAFKPVSLETLIDSPLFAGKHVARVDLDPDAAASGRVPVRLNVYADTADQLVMTPEQTAAHRALVQQADRLFGARHYAHYDFLLAISQQLGGIGLEHHQSSENGVDFDYFVDWGKGSVGRALLPHEYVHSWNGKFRRPADLATPNPNVPMQDSLLWVYEGQTQFWGDVLAARSGMVPMADARDDLAGVAAWAQSQAGRAWRNLQDTTNEPVMGARRGEHDWPDWQRGADYYDEMALVWLEADMRLRDLSAGARSMDDFARAFFGPQSGRADADTTPLTYRFDDVVATLEQLAPGGWSAFLRERLDTHRGEHLLAGLENAGWRLAWSDTAGSRVQTLTNRYHYDDFAWSLGFDVGRDGKLRNVRWNGPGYAAGLSRGVTLMAVDGTAYTADRLRRAVTAAKGKDDSAIGLLVRDGDLFRTVSIRYAGGLRYPKLERIEGREDRLTLLLSPKN